MATRSAQAQWKGALKTGEGTVRLESFHSPQPVTWKARTESEAGSQSSGMTSPEEFLAAAHSSCLAMAFTHALDQAGLKADTVDVKATYTFAPGKGITAAALELDAYAPHIDDDQFQHLAQEASENCPVSVALSGVPRTFTATRRS